MLRLLKAELRYSRVFLIITYGILVSIFILLYIFIDGEERMLNNRKLIGLVMIAGLIYFPVHTREEKRRRLYALLPFSTLQYGLIRLHLIIVYWLSLVLFYLVVTFIGCRYIINSILLWDIISATGIILCISAATSIYKDIKPVFTSKLSRFVLIFSYVILLVVLYTLLSVSSEILVFMHANNHPIPYYRYLVGIYLTPYGAAAFFLFGVAAASLSIYTYKRSRSFLK